MSEALTIPDAGISRVEQVYRKIKNNILDNNFPPGYQALEPEIAKQLGVSRTPVREALIRLEAEKLIELIPRRGMRVLPLVPNDLLEISQVLTGLEATAVELLAKKRLKDDELDLMEKCVSDMDAAMREEDAKVWAEADERFHSLIVELCGNHRLAHLIELVRAQFRRARLISLKLSPTLTESNEANKKLFSYIKNGEWEKAKEHHYQQRSASGVNLMELMDTYQLPHL